MTIETSREILIDPHSEDDLSITFDLTLFEIPCQYASVNVWDAFGTERQNVTNSQITKMRLDENWEEGAVVRESDHRIKHDQFKDDYVEDGHYSHQITEATWSKILNRHDYTFVNFFVPWCPWCRRFAPTWDQAAKKLDDVPWEDIGVIADMVRINCETNSHLCRDQRVMAYPTLRLYKKDQPVWPEYSGDRTEKALVNWLIEKAANPILSEHHTFENFTDRGCRVKGSLTVPRVPGNFHLEASSELHSLDATMTNVSHIVHHLSFGKKLPNWFIRRMPNEDQKRLSPMDGHLFSIDRMHSAPHHYIKIIPAIMEMRQAVGMEQIEGYVQVAQSSIAKYDADEVPEARFSYDLSPMGMHITQRGTHWYTYLTSMFALIGGTFTVISMIDMFLSKTSTTFKRRVNKLG